MKQTILKSVIILISFMSVEITYGQTKEETEKWILEKLMTYCTSKYDIGHRTFGEDFRSRYFKFDGSNLIYTYTHIKESTYIVTSRIEYQIPIWAIKTISINKSSVGEFDEYYFLTFSFENYCKDCKRIKKWEKDGKINIEQELKSTSIQINKGDPEENFIERFKKAIEHLQTFYPKPEKKKETF